MKFPFFLAFLCTADKLNPICRDMNAYFYITFSKVIHTFFHN